MSEFMSSTVAGRLSPTLSASQLARLAELGVERTADVGEVLYGVGDRRYPFIAIRDGEVAIRDAVGNEIVRHGASGFLGELNLLSGQTVFVTAVATEPLRYIAVERETLRSLPRCGGENSSELRMLVRPHFACQARPSSSATRAPTSKRRSD